MEHVKNDEIHSLVRENYGKAAEADSAGCGCSPSTDCCKNTKVTAEKVSVALGYLLCRKHRSQFACQAGRQQWIALST